VSFNEKVWNNNIFNLVESWLKEKSFFDSLPAFTVNGAAKLILFPSAKTLNLLNSVSEESTS